VYGPWRTDRERAILERDRAYNGRDVCAPNALDPSRVFAVGLDLVGQPRLDPITQRTLGAGPDGAAAAHAQIEDLGANLAARFAVDGSALALALGDFFECDDARPEPRALVEIDGSIAARLSFLG
jgi:hypothetical protein